MSGDHRRIFRSPGSRPRDGREPAALGVAVWLTRRVGREVPHGGSVVGVFPNYSRVVKSHGLLWLGVAAPPTETEDTRALSNS